MALPRVACRLAAHPLPRARVLQEASDAAANASTSPGGTRMPVRPAATTESTPRVRPADDRQAAGLRLDERHADHFVDRRPEKEVGPAVAVRRHRPEAPRRRSGARAGSMQANAASTPLPRRAIAHDDEFPIEGRPAATMRQPAARYDASLLPGAHHRHRDQPHGHSRRRARARVGAAASVNAARSRNGGSTSVSASAPRTLTHAGDIRRIEHQRRAGGFDHRDRRRVTVRPWAVAHAPGRRTPRRRHRECRARGSPAVRESRAPCGRGDR